MEHPVVWFEVMGEDAAKLQGFYGELFGWPLKGEKYATLEKVEAGIPGGVGPRAMMKGHPGVTFYVSTRDVEATIARSQKLGGKVVMPSTQLPGGPTIAMIEDPQGNRVGLVLAHD